MSDPELITMRCPQCDGGVEFPANGIGQKIACPHCQAEFILQKPVSKRPLVFGSICLVVLLIAAAFGAFALWHHPNPAELKAMRLERLRAKAQAGSTQAEFELAMRYFRGERGVETNLVEAVNWYRKAAEQGMAEAQSGLGWCYSKGYGVESNALEAVNWYRKAAEQGLPEAERRLGWCYETGAGLAKDAVEGAKWYRKAADQGDAKAQNNLGYCYEYGTGVASNAVEAVKWIRMAAEQGVPTAQGNLGNCYENGVGVASNAVEAVNWYRKAAEQGDAYGQDRLGTCYESGLGVDQDTKQAVKWYIKAAEQGGLNGSFAESDLLMMFSPEAPQTNATIIELLTESAQRGNPFTQKILADDYETLGLYNSDRFLGTTNTIEASKSYRKAVEWFQKAAEQGNADAQYKLGLHYRAGNGVEKSAEKAAEWFQKAAEQGKADAQYNLGLCYSLGEGIIRDDEEAFKWFRKSADRSFADFNEILKVAQCYAKGSGVAKDDREA